MGIIGQFMGIYGIYGPFRVQQAPPFYSYTTSCLEKHFSNVVLVVDSDYL